MEGGVAGEGHRDRVVRRCGWCWRGFTRGWRAEQRPQLIEIQMRFGERRPGLQAQLDILEFMGRQEP